MKLRSIICIFIILSSKLSIGHDRITYDEFAIPQWGYIIKSNNDTLFGSIQIFKKYVKEAYDPFTSFANKIIIEIKGEEKTTVRFSEIKLVVLGNKLFTFHGSEIWRIIDTPRIVRVYEGYQKAYFNIVTNAGMSTSVLSRDLRYPYIVQLGKSEPVNFYEDGIGYKRKLKTLFSYKKNVMEYLDTIGDIKFDDLPGIIDHINTLYK